MIMTENQINELSVNEAPTQNDFLSLIDSHEELRKKYNKLLEQNAHDAEKNVTQNINSALFEGSTLGATRFYKPLVQEVQLISRFKINDKIVLPRAMGFHTYAGQIGIVTDVHICASDGKEPWCSVEFKTDNDIKLRTDDRNVALHYE